jgi:hypothetical protein
MPGDKRLSDPRLMLSIWSAPRCRSTAFARMMAERGDYAVLHEPFSHVVNFGESRLGGRVARTERELIGELWRLAREGPVFFKDTTDFYYPHLLADRDFLAGGVHTFLIRHPAAAIASHYRLHPALQRDEIGFAWLAELYDAVASAAGTPPVVIDADDLVAHPRRTVQAYCDAVRIPYIPRALSWAPGMQAAWQRTSRWHQTASQTSGFVHTRAAEATVIARNPLLAGYLEYHLPFYDRLRAVALRT